MTSSSAADPPGSPDPGAEPLPRLGARVAEPDDGTGPVRIVGPRPGPPPASPSPRAAAHAPDPESEAAAEPDEAPKEEPEPVAEQLPETERPPGRAVRNLGQAIGVGVGLGAVILASLLIYRPAFLGVLLAAVLVAVVELTRALHAGGFRPPLVPLLVGTVAMEV
ncbi:MAG: phosphatidate cytidylyltransferase, partial [Geodermatophilales bacterium]|nr:phosphatidate cytidylyltransferase [Geodermatophilales bacterium]